MSIIRIKKARQKPYVTIDTTALNDKRLSFRAKGLHTYLMARPDDWQIYIDQLEKESPREARDAIRTAMKELEESGYVRRQRIRSELGRMMGWDTTVYETPLLAEQAKADEDLEATSIGLAQSSSPTSDEPSSDEPTSDEPSSDNPLLLINEKALSIEVTKTTSMSNAERARHLTPQQLVNGWNDICASEGLAKKLKVSDKLARQIKLRLHTYPHETFWEAVFNWISTNKRYHGENRSGWRCDFDWLMKNDDHVLRIFEEIPLGEEEKLAAIGGGTIA